MPKISSIYFTAPNAVEAERIARVLLEEGRVACVNIIPGALSLYRWEGKIQRDEEVVCFAKTRRGRVKELLERIPQLHPYAVPALFALPVHRMNPAANAWLAESVPKKGKKLQGK